jgi:hypothetical protein
MVAAIDVLPREARSSRAPQAGRQSRTVLHVPRLRPGGVSCHHLGEICVCCHSVPSGEPSCLPAGIRHQPKRGRRQPCAQCVILRVSLRWSRRLMCLWRCESRDAMTYDLIDLELLQVVDQGSIAQRSRAHASVVGIGQYQDHSDGEGSRGPNCGTDAPTDCNQHWWFWRTHRLPRQWCRPRWPTFWPPTPTSTSSRMSARATGSSRQSPLSLGFSYLLPKRCQTPVSDKRLGPLQQLTATTSCGGTTADCGSPRCSSVQSWRHREAVPQALMHTPGRQRPRRRQRRLLRPPRRWAAWLDTAAAVLTAPSVH